MKIANVDKVRTEDLFRYSELLTSTGEGYKTIESFMNNCYGMTWSMSEVAIQICDYLKATMYFDSRLNMWLDK